MRLSNKREGEKNEDKKRISLVGDERKNAKHRISIRTRGRGIEKLIDVITICNFHDRGLMFGP